MKKINIAIDGPAASGKSSVAKELAKKISFNYLDTGLMYRAFTFFCLKNNVNFNDEKKIIELCSNFNLELLNNKIMINNELISNDQLTKKVITDNINKISDLNFIRKYMNKVQKNIASKKGYILVGRDITTIVLPDAEIKIFLDANIKNRAKRRFEELKNKNITYQEILDDLSKRDSNDKNRKFGPLLKSDSAILLDNSNISLSETIDKIILILKEKGYNYV